MEFSENIEGLSPKGTELSRLQNYRVNVGCYLNGRV